MVVATLECEVRRMWSWQSGSKPCGKRCFESTHQYDCIGKRCEKRARKHGNGSAINTIAGNKPRTKPRNQRKGNQLYLHLNGKTLESGQARFQKSKNRIQATCQCQPNQQVLIGSIFGAQDEPENYRPCAQGER